VQHLRPDRGSTPPSPKGCKSHRQTSPPPCQEHRAHDPDQQGNPDEDGRCPHVAPQLVVHRRGRDADTDFATTTRSESGAPHRKLSRGYPTGPVCPNHAPQPRGRPAPRRVVSADMLTEFVRRLGCDSLMPLIVGNHHEQHVGALLDFGGQLLQRAIGQLIGERWARPSRAPCRSVRRQRAPPWANAKRTRHVQRPGFVFGGKAVVAQHGKHTRPRSQGTAQQRRPAAAMHLRRQAHIHAPPPHHLSSVRRR